MASRWILSGARKSVAYIYSTALVVPSGLHCKEQSKTDTETQQNVNIAFGLINSMDGSPELACKFFLTVTFYVFTFLF